MSSKFVFFVSIFCIFIIGTNTLEINSQLIKPELLYDVSILSSSQIPSFLPNIEYLGQGYNILFGNPLSKTGVDSGFKNQLVIEYEYEKDIKDSLSAYKRWIVPKGVKFSSYQSCSTSYSSKEISNMADYSNSLSAGLSIGGSFLGASFSASVDYKQVQKTLSSSDSMFVESHAQCILFDLGLYLNKKNSKVKFKSVFVNRLKQLAMSSSSSSQEDYFDFFKEYGTHITTQTKLGSKFGYRFQMSNSLKNTLKSQNLSVTAADIYCVSASFDTKKEKEASTTFREATQSWESFSFGAPPDPNNDVGKWASQAITNSLPVSMKLIPYAQVIDFIQPQDDVKLEEAEKSKLRIGFFVMFINYCSSLLLKNCIFQTIENVQLWQTIESKKYFIGVDGQSEIVTYHHWDQALAKENLFDIIPIDSELFQIYHKKKKKCLKSNEKNIELAPCDHNSQMGVLFIYANEKLQIWIKLKKKYNTIAVCANHFGMEGFYFKCKLRITFF